MGRIAQGHPVYHPPGSAGETEAQSSPGTSPKSQKPGAAVRGNPRGPLAGQSSREMLHLLVLQDFLSSLNHLACAGLVERGGGWGPPCWGEGKSLRVLWAFGRCSSGANNGEMATVHPPKPLTVATGSGLREQTWPHRGSLSRSRLLSSLMPAANRHGN